MRYVDRVFLTSQEMIILDYSQIAEALTKKAIRRSKYISSRFTWEPILYLDAELLCNPCK